MGQLGEREQAERYYRDALTVAEAILSPDDPLIDAISGRLGSLEDERGDDQRS